jgi:UDP-GlcNAc:undecaprenyl-phosphate/decaprenyl-phosphate GlcNAc-1-phosphate transferase
VTGSRLRPLDLGTPLGSGLASGPTSSLTTGATTGLTTGVATALTTVLLRRWPPGGAARWRRTNHRGEPVTLLEGPALVLGATAGLLAAPGVPPRVRAGAVAAVLGAGALGAYDDLAGDGRRKGLAGHLGALARGEVTTGAVKLLGLAATGLLAAVATGTPATGPAAAGCTTPSGVRWLADVAVGGAVVAGSANLLNLLDLRPGRALKAALFGAAALVAGGSRSAVSAGARSAGTAAAAAAPAAAAVGAAAVLLPADLGERAMLGDCGANAAGALLGVAALGRLGLRGRTALLLALVALTATSERISFTRVIESTPGLRELDRLGRRPPGSVESR